jgi:acyl-CoA thioesterase FadM
MTPDPHCFPVRVYYEDTDHSGLVYHANYLKFFERAREHWLGIELLLKLAREEGIGFVVYRAEVTYREGARFGDEPSCGPRALQSDYRLVLSRTCSARARARSWSPSDHPRLRGP